MALFSEREGRRTAPIEKEQMTQSEYVILSDICKNYFINLAWLFPIPCPDNATNITGTDTEKLSRWLSVEIPGLIINIHGDMGMPQERDVIKFQYDLLDLIEYVAKNIRDYTKGTWHQFFMHHELDFDEKKAQVFVEFKKAINNIFDKTGLQFILTDAKQIERKITTGAAATIAPAVAAVKEKGLRDLLNEALGYYKLPRPEDKQVAIEKLWDAYERLKTHHLAPGVDKKASATKLVNDMADGSAAFAAMFDAEFKALTDIGNDYRIRHHETNRVEITKSADYDYYFNRCLALIERALKTLPI